MPPSLPAIPTTAPKMTRSPSVLIGLQLSEVKLKKAEAVNDKSAPDVTGQRGRAAKTNALLGGIEQGVQLKVPFAFENETEIVALTDQKNQ